MGRRLFRLRNDHVLDAAVHVFAVGGTVILFRLVCAVSAYLKNAAVNAVLNQEVLHRISATLGKLLVRSRVSVAIRMPTDLEDYIRRKLLDIRRRLLQCRIAPSGYFELAGLEVNDQDV